MLSFRPYRRFCIHTCLSGAWISIAALLLAYPVQAQNNSLQPGDSIPSFDYQLLDERNRVTDETLRGTSYIIYIWSTVCIVCRQEMPELHQVYERLKRYDFEILSLSFDEEVDAVHAYRQEEYGMPWKHVFIGNDRNARTDVFNKFGVRGMPSKILVSSDGTVIDVVVGRSENLTERIEQYIRTSY